MENQNGGAMMKILFPDDITKSQDGEYGEAFDTKLLPKDETPTVPSRILDLAQKFMNIFNKQRREGHIKKSVKVNDTTPALDGDFIDISDPEINMDEYFEYMDYMINLLPRNTNQQTVELYNNQKKMYKMLVGIGLSQQDAGEKIKDFYQKEWDPNYQEEKPLNEGKQILKQVFKRFS